MLEKKEYANGQKVYELEDNVLTYFYEDATVKAKGPFVEDKMEGEWVFYRKTGDLWQVGHFKDNQKHGRWLRYSRDGEVEYDEHFENGKLLKKK
ncbi:toxin-antitoxin system YwqK family antitoxin [Alkalibacterium pelagium]|uniref:MORN repeat variant n=1 Tax=Alkalibacterium pelagium TaxID=426702 RepID=A0A1H7J9Z6_9LACT|nr:hypothetical protein [Alkalibacterium pelagium]GEN50239.1 hypothetical protein APE02nite_09040 [Alkalibacterium pelagium]SEK70105.1 hypothetical protein SAMN04488099_10589 [Alkalibacterium pelagium]